eukprot:NODE_4536_length_344_cov_183.671186_g3932_i0.p2 GENE.NODE_4536_length_344_cov_183.671186_g3932_i0~~NODE_4536_length_344_cov_183.671186_g3932_i0.p2  ORF type:complete len:51 (+),score=4.97 NODE_4536_length_344_cov_183.671186_g3932_i0:29-181(+)
MGTLQTSVDHGSENFRSEFDRLLENIVIAHRDAEEQAYLDGANASVRPPM